MGHIWPGWPCQPCSNELILPPHRDGRDRIRVRLAHYTHLIDVCWIEMNWTWKGGEEGGIFRNTTLLLPQAQTGTELKEETFLLSRIPPLLFVIVLFPFDCLVPGLSRSPRSSISLTISTAAGFRLQCVDRHLEGEMKLTASSAGLPAKLPPWHWQRGGPPRGFSGSSFGCVAKQKFLSDFCSW